MENTRTRTDLMLINHVSVARWFFSLGNQEDIIINISRLQLRRTVAPELGEDGSNGVQVLTVWP